MQNIERPSNHQGGIWHKEEARVEAEMDVVIRLSRSKLKRAQPGAECRESGTFRSEWEVGKAISLSTPNLLPAIAANSLLTAVFILIEYGKGKAFR